MRKPAAVPTEGVELRRLAERRLKEKARRGAPDAAAQDLAQLNQELQIHQFELEIQNEELQQARNALEALLERYTDLYDFAPVGYVTLARDGGIVQANLAGARLLEVARARLVGRRFADFVSRESRAWIAEFLQKVCDAPTKLTCEAALVNAGNQPRHVQMEAIASRDGQGCRVAMIDTTEHRRAEAARETSEARYRMLFETSSDGILLLEAASGAVLAANPSLCRLLGLPAEHFAGGRLLWEIEPLRSLAASRQAFLDRQRRGNAHDQLALDTGDGRHLDVEVASHTYPVPQGHVTQLTIHDISERRHSEQALREAQERLQVSQKLEAVGRLAGGVAHQFNNKLGVIIGYADLLRSGTLSGAAESQKLDRILEAAQYSAELTRQLLAVASKQVLQPTSLSPSALVARALPLLAPQLGSTVQVKRKLDAQGSVHADPTQLESVLAILVANASDAMPGGGGTLTIETADVELSEGAERPEGIPPGRYVTLTVSDTGNGMDEAAKTRIFEPFFTTKPIGEGTGLALAAVYGTVKQSGGYLLAENTPEGGATFRIYLPRGEAACAS